MKGRQESLFACAEDEVLDAPGPDGGDSGLVGFVRGHRTEFMVSMALHSLVLFIMLVLGSMEGGPSKTDIITCLPTPEFDRPFPPPPEITRTDPPPIDPVLPKDTDDPVEIDQPVLTDDQPVDPEPIGREDSQDPLRELVNAGTTDDLSAMPEGIRGPDGRNPGSPDSGGLPSVFGNRTPPGKRIAREKHGTGYAVQPLELALKWLKYHQESDGSWDASKYEGRAPFQPAMTACALLAFLGEGYSEHIGPYKDTVRRGVAWLNEAVEAKDGKPWFDNGYGTGMVLMALSEASIFGSGSRTRTNANAVARFVLEAHTPGKGWRYRPNSPDCDQSVSGWMALGLKDAKAAELEALGPANAKRLKEVFDEYTAWVKDMTPEGTGLGCYEQPQGGSPNMTWVGMFQRMFLGAGKDDPYLAKASEHTLGWIDSNKWVGGEQPGDAYGVYYGTLACFQRREAVWKAWNAKMKATLPASQRKGDPRLLGGSWDPTPGHTGEAGGRVLTTALLALSLEATRYDHFLGN